MILSFSVFKDKIENGTKTQTIRRYSEFQYKRFCNAKKYQLYWHNPRNGGKLIREVEPSEKPFLIAFNNSDYHCNIDLIGGSKERFQGDILIDFAKRDGFETSAHLFGWFAKTYGFEMYRKKFMVLRWKP
jgi:hypothetical protein